MKDIFQKLLLSPHLILLHEHIKLTVLIFLSSHFLVFVFFTMLHTTYVACFSLQIIRL